MSKNDAPKPRILSDEEIVSAKVISRRSMLATTGIGAAALVAASIKGAHASDAKTVDTDRPPTTSDPDRD